ncbi:hypothetical protein [Caldisphaera sp.]|nr:hypothetical protein [Caldisphaera sp.]
MEAILSHDLELPVIIAKSCSLSARLVNSSYLRYHNCRFYKPPYLN